MDKIWFIGIDGQQEGPFTLQELRRDSRIQPDTLVWREGFANWIPIKKVEELKEVFRDEPRPPADEEEVDANGVKLSEKDAIALNLQSDLPPILWMFLILLALLYLMYWLYGLYE